MLAVTLRFGTSKKGMHVMNHFVITRTVCAGLIHPSKIVQLGDSAHLSYKIIHLSWNRVVSK